jgi:anti-sigma B factor antagonist
MPVAHLTGEIDISNATDLFESIESSVEIGVVVDFSDVSFIDASGLGRLVATARHRPVRVVAVPGTEPRLILEMTSLTDLIPTFDTVDEALHDR